MFKIPEHEGDDLPFVRCLSCDREVQCMRMADGTVYKPIAWSYPAEHTPLLGYCGACGPPLEWCSACGNLWAHDYEDCPCPVVALRPFPDPAAARAAWKLGGHLALHAIEQQLYLSGAN